MRAWVFDNTGGYGIRPYDRNMTHCHPNFLLKKPKRNPRTKTEVPFLFL